MRLEGRRALITGGTQGIGAAIAKALAKAGCDVIVHGLQQDDHALATESACRELGVRVDCVFQNLAVQTDLAVASLVKQVDALQGGQVDILVNNAGTFCDRPFLEMDLDTLEKTMRLNVYAGYFLTQVFAQRWVLSQTRGRILFTGSINGQLAEADHTAYDSSKGAVHAMVRSLCVALAPHGIRVNAMAPGLVVTPLTGEILEKDADVMEWMKLHTPNGKVPDPESCGGTALFLLSDEADHVHGQTVFVDGGMSAWQQPDLPARFRS